VAQKSALFGQTRLDPNMIETIPNLMPQIRDRFAHVDTCPFTGERIFFENAGGALTLKSVVDTSAKFAAIPDNQGRDNAASHALVDIIKTAKSDAADLFGVTGGQFFVGESGTELLFRVIRSAAMGAQDGGNIVGSTFEHPASRSAALHWAQHSDRPYLSVAHHNETGLVTADDYAAVVDAKTRVATILHSSPVTGMGVDVAAISAAIRAVAPECFIIVDGIQNAAHGAIDIESYDIDGYVVSPYKMFSRHGYGFAWVSDRLTALSHEQLLNGPKEAWEFGTRDTGSYATMSDVVSYLDWLGGHFSTSTDRRERLVTAGHAILAHETELTNAMIHGIGNLKGLAQIDGVEIIGGIDNPKRKGLVSFRIQGRPSSDIVTALNDRGIRTHTRKADHYSGGILNPLGWSDCVRVSVCHYNTLDEIRAFLTAMQDITA
jgi:cysteine desulfurase/selenocysteine lyase